MKDWKKEYRWKFLKTEDSLETNNKVLEIETYIDQIISERDNMYIKLAEEYTEKGFEMKSYLEMAKALQTLTK